MEIQGRYAWTGNNRYGDNHRHLRIFTKQPGALAFELRTVSSAGPMGSAGDTLRGRVEPSGEGRFVLVGEVSESWSHDDDSWSQEHPSTARLDLRIRSPERVEVDGEPYDPEIRLDDTLRRPGKGRAVAWLGASAALAVGILAWTHPGLFGVAARPLGTALPVVAVGVAWAALDRSMLRVRVTHLEVRVGGRWSCLSFPCHAVRSAKMLVNGSPTPARTYIVAGAGIAEIEFTTPAGRPRTIWVSSARPGWLVEVIRSARE